MARQKRKGKRKKRNKKKKTGNKIDVHAIISNLRGGIKPGKVEQNKKAKANKKACRKKGEENE